MVLVNIICCKAHAGGPRLITKPCLHNIHLKVSSLLLACVYYHLGCFGNSFITEVVMGCVQGQRVTLASRLTPVFYLDCVYKAAMVTLTGGLSFFVVDRPGRVNPPISGPFECNHVSVGNMDIKTLVTLDLVVIYF